MRKKALSTIHNVLRESFYEFVLAVKAYSHCSQEMVKHEDMEVEFEGEYYQVMVCSEPEYDLHVTLLLELHYPEFSNIPDWGVLEHIRDDNDTTPMRLVTRTNNTIEHQELINDWMTLDKKLNELHRLVLSLMQELEREVDRRLPVNSILVTDMLTLVKANNSEALMDNYGTAAIWGSLKQYTLKQLSSMKA